MKLNVPTVRIKVHGRRSGWHVVRMNEADALRMLCEGWRLHITQDGSGAKKIRAKVHHYDHGTMYLGRWLLRPEDGFEVDHRNHDPLDNRRSNLRIVTGTQNLQHRHRFKNNKVGYKGVEYHERDGKKRPYRARISANGIRYRLGNYFTAEEAARAYNEAALLHHGEFAVLNVLPD